MSDFDGKYSTGPKAFTSQAGINVWTSEPDIEEFANLKQEYKDILDSVKAVPRNKYIMLYVTKKARSIEGLREPDCENPDIEKEEKE